MSDAIAIVGMACRFPGASNPEAFWQNLLAGRDSTSLATAAQMGIDPELLFDPAKGRRDRYYALRGGFVLDTTFNPAGFRLAPERLHGLDKLYAWTLSVARDALVDGGVLSDTQRLARCGLVLGNLSFPTHASHRLLAPIYRHSVETGLSALAERPVQLDRGDFDGPVSPADAAVAGGPAALAAEALGLGAGWLALDAACASSLYAIKLACAQLRAGKADLMLASAVSAADALFIHMGFSIFQAYPEGGSSRPLDRSTKGLTSGEGAGALLLKRLSDAERDGDRIYAVIRGVGWSNDGAGKHVLVPNPKGQLLAYQRAYAEAGLSPERTAYIECHATGTPVGDSTELQTIENFFGPHGHLPLIGSVKSNFGHMLTAAGMAGVMKVAMALNQGLIPPTIGVEQPLSTPSGQFGPRQIVRTPTPWPSERRTQAAVSAFGFGGTNAHLVLEAPTPTQKGYVNGARVQQQRSPAPQPAAPPSLAIVGMGACFGPWQSLHAVEQGLVKGERALGPLPATRWKGIEQDGDLLRAYHVPGGHAPAGAYLDQFTIDSLRYKIPPAAGDQPIPQQLLILKVADEALRDAGMRPGGNVAVLVAMEAELAVHQFRGRVDLTWQLPAALAQAGITLSAPELAQLEEVAKAALNDPAQVNQYTSFIGNLMACRIAALWDFSGPAFTLSAEECGFFRALAVAQDLLAEGSVEAVVVGAVDLAGGVESVLARSLAAAPGDQAPGHDLMSNGWLVGEGAGAIVLRRRNEATDAAQRIYATLDGLSVRTVARNETPAAAVARTAEAALHAAGASANQIEALELWASGLAHEDAAELAGLAAVYGNAVNPATPHYAIGSAKASVGHAYAAAGVAGLIRAALAIWGSLHHAVPAWTGPREQAAWAKTAFYVPSETRPWMRARDGKRMAAISGLGGGATVAHAILAEAAPTLDTPLDLRTRHALPALIPLAAADLPSLLAQLAELEAELATITALEDLVRTRIAAWRESQPARLVLALVATNFSELKREIGLARSGLPDALANGRAWETPGGSAFTPQPLGQHGIALVYPGAFTGYPGLGRGLLAHFPALQRVFERTSTHAGEAMAERRLYLRQQQRPNTTDLERQKLALRNDTVRLMMAGVSSATLYTALMREGFGLKPTAAFGYSMGESTMQWALGLWRDGDEIAHRLATSPLFTQRLAGRRATARAYLGLGDDAPNDFWQVYVVRTAAARAIERLRHEQRVFITHINTPNEVVIGGLAEALPAVLADLGGEAFRAPFDSIMHCRPVEPELQALIDFHRFPVGGAPGLQMYTAAHYGPAEPTSEAIAHNIARAVCQPVDFPRLINRAYADGARIFLELGPGNSCTRWVSENLTLAGKPHLALAVCRRGADEGLTLVQALARLVAHHVPLDLGPLIVPAPATATTGRTLRRPIVVGGPSIVESIVTDEHRRMVAAARTTAPEAQAAPQPILTLAPLPRASAPGEEPELDPQTPAPTLSGQAAADVDLSDYATVLATRQRGLHALVAAVETALGQVGKPAAHLAVTAPSPNPTDLATPPPSAFVVPSSVVQPGQTVIWDEAALLEFARGSIAAVFGPEYAVIDDYGRRTRLPMPPYLLVSRVTRLNAERGAYRPCSLTTEYDIPADAWYCVDGQIPWAVSVESGQCDLLLISYLGIDFQCRGERVYRLLDCTLTFLDDLPKAGETLRYDISINSFARNGATLLFFFSYECFVGERMVLKMDGGCAGFFSDQELADGRGVIDTDREIKARREAIPQHFTPLLPLTRTSLDLADLRRLSVGDVAGCFGPAYDQRGRNPSLRLPPPAMLMIDRVTSMDPQGGAWGLGLIIAEKDLRPDDWYFPCHFKDDEVLAGSLQAEGCGQLLQCYMLALGLQTYTSDARFQPIEGLPQVVRCRGQVTPKDSLLVYRMEVTAIGLEPEPFARTNVDIIVDGRIVVRFNDLSLKLREKEASRRPPEMGQWETPASAPLCNEQQITEFATGSLAACFGPAYAIYDGRRAPRTPNGDLQLISRILRVDGQRGDPKAGDNLVSQYDVELNPWFCRQNSAPETPYSVLMELGLQPCGFLSAWLGSTLPYPNHDFYFRNLDGSGHMLRQVDLRGKTVTNRVTLRASTAIDGVIIQKFDYALECDGAPFFVGDAAFGYFAGDALARQVGLDSGRTSQSWLATNPGLPTATLNLADANLPLYQAPAGQVGLQLPRDQFDLLDQVTVVSNAGTHGLGYVYASRLVNPADWFFRCHFHQDPVMPGSLGLEAMLRAMQAMALHEGLGRDLVNPRFITPDGMRCVWKYRGQIPSPKQPTVMGLEIHLTRRERMANGGILLVGAGSLWRDGLRIYEVKDLALGLVSG
ncbi:MAG: PfaB family protein [Oscillochloridaceae bacterium umkhey_bin13]